MRKILLSFFFLTVLAVSLCANQLTYRKDSPEVKAFYSIKYLTGTQIPEPAFPVSGEQLAGLLKELDTSKLNGYAQNLYYELLDELENSVQDFRYGKAGVDISLPFNFQIRGRTAGVNLHKADSKAYDFLLFNPQNSPDGHGFDVKLEIGDNFAGRFNYSLAYPDSKEYRNNHFLFISPFFAFNEGDENHKPYQAYASVGTDVLNLVIGRDRTSAGNGTLGGSNLAFSDNMIYQDFAKFSAVSFPFSYDLTAYVFDNQIEGNFKTYPYCPGDYFQLLVSHRFSTALSKHLSLSAYEGTLAYGNSFSIIEAFNPFMILHNTYSFKKSNLNNFCGAEFNCSIKNFEISAAFFLDQLQFDFEIRKTKASCIAPHAWAAQLNTKAAWDCKSFITKAFGEITYTSPVCYLKEIHGKDLDSTEYWWYQQDLLVSSVYEDDSNIEFTGYKYGPNTVSFALGTSLESEKWNLEANILLMERGSYGRNHDMIIPGKDLGMNEEESAEYLVALSPFVFAGESVEYSIQAVLKGSYKVSESFSFNGGFGYVHAKNLNNITGEKLDDFQFSISATIDLFPLSVKGVSWVKKLLKQNCF